MSQKIKQCRICGGSSGVRKNAGGWLCYATCLHMTSGPAMPTEAEAILEWNKMMSSNIPETLETIDTDYRDRIDRMVAAQISGYCANPIPSSVWDLRLAVTIAQNQIAAIDKAIYKPEAYDENAWSW